MLQPTPGKIEIVNLRNIWKSEERDFTPWLSENIDQLSALLGLQITVEQTEKRVGSYELDIFGRTDNDAIVIVENQLEATDHTHLGQLLTYAAVLDAAIIVWVATEVRDEHRRAIEWLNTKTVDEISFFLVRPEAFSINGSPPAVRLNLEVPGNSSWREFLRKFWEDLYPYLVAHGHPWAQGRSATTDCYISSNVGKSGVTVQAGRVTVRTAGRLRPRQVKALLYGWHASCKPAQEGRAVTLQHAARQPAPLRPAAAR
jgi:hypothetical protein